VALTGCRWGRRRSAGRDFIKLPVLLSGRRLGRDRRGDSHHPGGTCR
jgi:hypothetical protein